jgi:uncharacterized protein (DUF58 family)
VSDDPTRLLPSPGVSFAPGFSARLGRLVPRLASTVERREAAGGARISGGGEEFVGHRPYLPGEDLRRLDWSLLARLDRPFVRVSRREAAEDWVLLLDTSASMGVGVPGKLQAAAEVATGLAAVGAGLGARVRLMASDGTEQLLRRRADLPRWLAGLERLRADGERGLGELTSSPSRFQGAGRVFLLGDLFDLEPERLAGLGRRGRELAVVRVLARTELAPGVELGAGTAVEWVDPEGGARRDRRLDAATLGAYERALEAELERWELACTRRRAAHVVHAADAPFEEAVARLVAP